MFGNCFYFLMIFNLYNKNQYKKMSLFSSLITIIKNGRNANKKFVFFPKNLFCLQFLKLMFLEGLIANVQEINSSKFLKIQLKYDTNGSSVFKEIKILSTPSKSLFLTYSHLTKLKEGVGVIFISTNEGLLTDDICLKRKIGGKALCYIV